MKPKEISRDLGKQLLPVGMLVVLDSVFNRVIRKGRLFCSCWEKAAAFKFFCYLTQVFSDGKVLRAGPFTLSAFDALSRFCMAA